MLMRVLGVSLTSRRFLLPNQAMPLAECSWPARVRGWPQYSLSDTVPTPADTEQRSRLVPLELVQHFLMRLLPESLTRCTRALL